MRTPVLPLACRSRVHCPDGVSHVYVAVASLHSVLHVAGERLEDSWTRYMEVSLRAVQSWNYQCQNNSAIKVLIKVCGALWEFSDFSHVSSVNMRWMKTHLELTELEFWINPSVIKTSD